MSFKRVKLDRAVANSKWTDLFRDFTFTILPRTSSDHHTVCLKCTDVISSSFDRPLKFENAWMTDENFLEVVKRNCFGTNMAMSHSLHQPSSVLKAALLNGLLIALFVEEGLY